MSRRKIKSERGKYNVEQSSFVMKTVATTESNADIVRFESEKLHKKKNPVFSSGEIFIAMS